MPNHINACTKPSSCDVCVLLAWSFCSSLPEPADECLWAEQLLHHFQPAGLTVPALIEPLSFSHTLLFSFNVSHQSTPLAVSFSHPQFILSVFARRWASHLCCCCCYWPLFTAKCNKYTLWYYGDNQLIHTNHHCAAVYPHDNRQWWEDEPTERDW